MITDQQRAKLLTTLPYLANKDLTIQEKISCILGDVHRVVSALEIHLGNAYLFYMFRNADEEFKNDHSKLEKEFDKASRDISTLGLYDLIQKVLEIEEFKSMESDLLWANEERNFIVHYLNEAFSGLLPDEEGQWHVIYETFVLAKSLARTLTKVKRASTRALGRYNKPTTVINPSEVNEELLRDALAIVADGNLILRWLKKYKPKSYGRLGKEKRRLIED